MKRVFVLAMLLFSFTLTPVSSSAVSTSAAIPIPAASPSNPQRIYGTNVASEVYALTSRTTYEGFIETLTENGSRYVMSDARLIGNNGDAREWIVDQLTTLSAGRMEIELVGSYLSIVARLPGYLPGEHPGFVVSAHYDSPNGSPGANDDGSGIGVLLELARVMSYYEWPLDIYFCAYNGANSLNPLSGSKQVSLEAFNEGMEFLAMYNLDTLLYQNRFADLDKRILLGYSSDADYHVGHYWADLAKMSGSFYGYDIISPIPHGSLPIWQSSDHYPFYQKGYQNVLCAYESGYMYDGVSGTLADQIGYRYFAVYLGREVAGILAATMALTMSRAYGERIHLYPKGTINGGSSRTFHIAITTPTTLNITCRWFGGGVSFRLYTPDGTLYAS
ncbi:MAG: M28 family peptidase, partial [Promethearchaeota archaeon]